MTKDLLTAIRKRLEAATPGPWRTGMGGYYIEGPTRTVGKTFTHPDNAQVDADLIANAPTDLAALLEHIAELEKFARHLDYCTKHVAGVGVCNCGYEKIQGEG